MEANEKDKDLNPTKTPKMFPPGSQMEPSLEKEGEHYKKVEIEVVNGTIKINETGDMILLIECFSQTLGQIFAWQLDKQGAIMFRDLIDSAFRESDLPGYE